MPSITTLSRGQEFAVNSSFKAKRDMNASISRLATGIRTQGGKDPVGAAIASSVTTQSRSAFVAARNANDGISFLQAAESVLFEIANINMRLRELAVQKTSGLLHTAEINAIAAEENALIIAADKIADSKLNDQDLLSEVSIAINVQGSLATVGAANKPQLASGVANVDKQMATIMTALGQVAAGMNALKGFQSNMNSLSTNAAAAASRIQDTDFARESAILAQSSIMNQSALAMLAQANRAQANFLSILE